MSGWKQVQEDNINQLQFLSETHCCKPWVFNPKKLTDQYCFSSCSCAKCKLLTYAPIASIGQRNLKVGECNHLSLSWYSVVVSTVKRQVTKNKFRNQWKNFNTKDLAKNNNRLELINKSWSKNQTGYLNSEGLLNTDDILIILNIYVVLLYCICPFL